MLCLHAGQAQPTAPNPRVKVGGQSVVTQTTPYTIAACALASSGNPFCATAQWITAATRVRADGIPVLLQDSQAVCASTGTGLNIVVTQMRVKGT